MLDLDGFDGVPVYPCFPLDTWQLTWPPDAKLRGLRTWLVTAVRKFRIELNEKYIGELRAIGEDGPVWVVVRVRYAGRCELDNPRGFMWTVEPWEVWQWKDAGWRCLVDRGPFAESWSQLW